MKTIIKTALLSSVVLMLVACTQSSFAQARKKADNDTREWRYELECVGTGTEGTYLVKVFSYSKRSNVALEQTKKNAVHGIIFKGFGGGGRGCTSQRPLASSPAIEDEKADFFKTFFEDGGKYMKYVGVSTDGTIDDVVKVGKEYKVGVIVSVQKDALRRDLEAAGVIKGLASGF